MPFIAYAKAFICATERTNTRNKKLGIKYDTPAFASFPHLGKLKANKMPNDTFTTKDRLMAKRLTVKDLAERLGVATVTVRRWIYAGEAPPHIRIGRTIRFRLEDIEAWEAERAAEQLERASARRDDLRRLLQSSGQRRPASIG